MVSRAGRLRKAARQQALVRLHGRGYSPGAMRPFRVLSWNVNGLRACERKGFSNWLARSRASVVGLQEVRAFEAQVPERIRRARWHQHYAPAERPGYSGVALLSRRRPDIVETALAPRFDVEGRAVIARFGKLVVCSAYFPKGDGPNRDLSRIPYKLAFYQKLRRRLELYREEGNRVIVMGDFNTAHREIDLARPRQNVENSGFRPEERRAFERWLRAGWVDTFRAFTDEGGHYTWWSQRFGLRERNVGWRIDYVLVGESVMPFVRGAFIQRHVHGSDHCPIGVDLDPAVIEG
jgi:exodeoxyribonuclease-3